MRRERSGTLHRRLRHVLVYPRRSLSNPRQKEEEAQG